MRKKGNYWTLRRIRMIADYQFFVGAGYLLFPDGVDIHTSPRTEKIKEIRQEGVHLASLNARTGLFSLSIEGARRLDRNKGSPYVTIRGDVAPEVSKGGNVFAKHITDAEPSTRAGNEGIVFSENSSLLAVGHFLLSGYEAKRFKHGVAIKVRRGVDSRHVIKKNGSKGNAPSDGQDGS